MYRIILIELPFRRIWYLVEEPIWKKKNRKQTWDYLILVEYRSPLLRMLHFKRDFTNFKISLPQIFRSTFFTFQVWFQQLPFQFQSSFVDHFILWQFFVALLPNVLLLVGIRLKEFLCIHFSCFLVTCSLAKWCETTHISLTSVPLPITVISVLLQRK